MIPGEFTDPLKMQKKLIQVTAPERGSLKPDQCALTSLDKSSYSSGEGSGEEG